MLFRGSVKSLDWGLAGNCNLQMQFAIGNLQSWISGLMFQWWQTPYLRTHAVHVVMIKLYTLMRTALSTELGGIVVVIFVRASQWFLPVDEMEGRVEVIGIAHQLSTHLLHQFLGILI